MRVARQDIWATHESSKVCSGRSQVCSAGFHVCSRRFQVCSGETKVCSVASKSCSGLSQVCSGRSQVCSALPQVCSESSKVCSESSQVCSGPSTVARRNCRVWRFLPGVNGAKWHTERGISRSPPGGPKVYLGLKSRDHPKAGRTSRSECARIRAGMSQFLADSSEFGTD
jgi:hypothetical protein